MARKVFLSFLGTNYYIKTKYYFEEECKESAKTTHFIQEETISKTCSNWSKNDKIYIFLTEEAKAKNWNNPAQKGHRDGEYNGLSKILNDLHLKAEIIPIENVPEGFSEEEILEIFLMILDVLENEDELYLDITHAFRFMPMLMVVLINYAKVTKNITVKHIYYGAFEKLGPAYEVKNMNEKERFAPILDLVSYSNLQDWANAANSFVKFGNAKLLNELTQQEINPILKETKGQDEIAKNLRKFIKDLTNFTSLLTTNRGLDILSGETGYNLKTDIEKIKNNTIPQIKPILDKISEKLDNLDSKNDVINGFRAVKWCIDSNLIQQAYSMLRESVITYVLYKSFPDDFEKLKSDGNKRELVSAAFKIISEKMPEEKWNNSAKDNKELIDKIIKDCYPDELIKEYSSLGDYRNDIMHAGFRQNAKNADKIINKIIESFQKIVQILNVSL